MAGNTATNSGNYSIGIVERDTGIGRDTLRIWERRYGFPEPERNEKGERVYSDDQVRRLQRVRRLLDQGLRPGKVLPLSEDALHQLEASLLPQAPQQADAAIQELVDTVRCADTGKVESLLQTLYQNQGMQRFVVETVTPLLSTVGELWARGRLQIFQEHFLSDQLIRFLNTQIAKLQKTDGKPLVLLATLPGEEHTLGLLMVFAMLSSHGVSAVNLGGEVPMDQIAQAVQQFRADVVGVTFSGSYQYTHIRSHLLELRQLLPAHVKIWAGGEGVRRLRKLPAGVTKCNSLQKLPV